MDGVHALTDITGFGVAAHSLELARGANSTVLIDFAQVPMIDGVREMASRGMVTGASGRNWAGYGSDVDLPAGFADAETRVDDHPQTSGGLLVSCTRDSVDAVLGCFAGQGFAGAAVNGSIQAGAPGLTIR